MKLFILILKSLYAGFLLCALVAICLMWVLILFCWFIVLYVLLKG